MSSLSPFLTGLPAFHGPAAARITPQSPAVHTCWVELVADIPERHRERLFEGLGRMRRADDMWQWRAALYTAIAVSHGEAVARERLACFDACIKG
jgi:hypothetical protein